ncbi:MAG: hypothetical protein HKM04_09420 [Legionellales bacterium]|nr:hypothetical protein [Legionellales bacterium]
MLPKTSPQHYLTGMTALNIPCPDEGYGDWHFYEAFFGRGDIQPKIFVAGKGEKWNTLPLFGDFGIYECSHILREHGVPLAENEKVYAAGHYRAALDMLYDCLLDNQYPYHIDLADWFDNQTQINRVLEKAEAELIPVLNTEQQEILKEWMSKQISND